MALAPFDPFSPPDFPRFTGAHEYQFLGGGVVRILAGSRLHFGFLDLSPRLLPGWQDRGGNPSLPIRRFGGVGLMIPQPGISVLVQPFKEWLCGGLFPEVAQKHCQSLVAYVASQGFRAEPRMVTVEHSAPHHAGLGTGTQLALAIGKALLLSWGVDMKSPELAKILGRGRRSAIGIHGFTHGGLIVEGGKADPNEISPLVACLPWPAEWAVDLDYPDASAGVHGKPELDAFEQILSGKVCVEALRENARNVLMGLVPALLNKDLVAFQKFMLEMNHRTGSVFDPLDAKKAPDENRGLGNQWAQSSWGPVRFQFKKITG